MEKDKNITSLPEIYKNFKDTLFWTNEELYNVISYEQDGNYIEYTEWYWFRNNTFTKKMENIVNEPYFKKVFYIIYSSYYSSNNEEMFLKLLSRFLSRLIEKIENIKGNNADYDVIFSFLISKIMDDATIKNYLLLNNIDWDKNNNANKKQAISTNLIFYIYDLFKEFIENKEYLV